MTEQERILLRGCLKGEKSTWDAFVNQYSGLVYHTIKKTLSFYHVEYYADIVEDLFQEFFLSLMRDDFRKLRQFREERSTNLATWLRIIVSRQAIDFLRRQRPSTGDAIEIQAPNHANPSIFLLNQEQNRLLARALETLRPRDGSLLNSLFTKVSRHRRLQASSRSPKMPSTLRKAASLVSCAKY